MLATVITFLSFAASAAATMATQRPRRRGRIPTGRRARARASATTMIVVAAHAGKCDGRWRAVVHFTAFVVGRATWPRRRERHGAMIARRVGGRAVRGWKEECSGGEGEHST